MAPLRDVQGSGYVDEVRAWARRNYLRAKKRLQGKKERELKYKAWLEERERRGRGGGGADGF